MGTTAPRPPPAADPRVRSGDGRRIRPPLLLLVLAAAGAAPAYPPPVPAGLVLTVRETEGIARTDEVVRSGIPIPRGLNLTAVSGLTLVDGGGTPVPAEFEVLARWDAGLGTSAPIQWLLVTFPASVGASAAATYRVVTDGSAGPNPLPPGPLTLTQVGSQWTVATGAATFRLGGNANLLFDEVRLPSGTLLSSGGALAGRVAATDVTHAAVRAVKVEHAGPLVAILVVEGAYDLPPVAGGGLGSRRRYVFRWRSPTAVVRHSVAWEGDRCGLGNLECGGAPNGLEVERLRDRLGLALAPPLSVTAAGSAGAAPVSGTAPSGAPAWVRTALRATRTSPLSFDVVVPGTGGAAGTKADAGLLCVGNGTGAVAIALDHMHRYEPQALRLLSDGTLAIDVADDRAWLGARQGLFATFAVAALPAAPPAADLARLVRAPMAHPLRAWPEPAWWAASDAVLELPVGPIASPYAAYDGVLADAMTRTLQKEDELGLPGLQTFGLFPRQWGDPVNTDEVDCGADPTPGETWDDLYWCATWTDYHNAASTAPIRAMRTGEVALLDEVALPAALRMLHTQVMQCAPADPFFYCGQAPSGYGGYRLDNNSSHAYFDNLVLHYWLTGDRTVLDTLSRGASTMRDYLCTRRPAAPCLPTDPPVDVWAQLTGRVAAQWSSVFRFLGLALDASYLDDYRANLGRAVTQAYVEASQGGVAYGFWLPGGSLVTGPGTYASDQLWMASLYDMNVLDRLRRDTNDAPIGSPAIAPSRVTQAWARTLQRWGATVAPGGDGTAAGAWPNGLLFTWAGGRLGGTLTNVAPDLGGSDPFLYDVGKSLLSAVVVRSAFETGDPALGALGRDLTQFGVNAAAGNPLPLGKMMAEYTIRLHPAVARVGETSGAVATRLHTATPCRALDTRAGAGALAAGTLRTFGVSGVCSVPASARSVAANLTVVTPSADGDLRVFPAGSGVPLASAINFRAGQVRANNAILALGAAGAVSVQTDMPSGAVHLVLDVVGWFE